MSKILDDFKKKVAAEKAKDPKAFAKKYKSAPTIVEEPGMGRGKNVASATQGPMIYFNYSYTNKGKTTKASLGISCSTCVPTYGIAKIEVSPNDPVDSNMKNFLDRSKTIDAEALVRQFAATIQGTYKMTPDNYFLPTSVQFTPTESGNAFTLNNN